MVGMFSAVTVWSNLIFGALSSGTRAFRDPGPRGRADAPLSTGSLADVLDIATGLKRGAVQYATVKVRGRDVRVAYREYGNPSASKVLVSVHGLTRNSADFDYLARRFGRQYRILVPDMPGRGFSQTLKRDEYGFDTYKEVMEQLFDHWNLRQGADKAVTWLGTSMGGFLGIMMADEGKVPISRLILNDVGPTISPDALLYLGKMLSQQLDKTFETKEQALKFLKSARADGPMDEGQWDIIFDASMKQNEQGRWQMSYDPAILGGVLKLDDVIPPPAPGMEAWVQNLPELPGMGLWRNWVPYMPDLMRAGAKLWDGTVGEMLDRSRNIMFSHSIQPAWDKIRIPTLVIRGKDSQFLTEEAITEMQKRPGGNISVMRVTNAGHAPSLGMKEQVIAVRDWIEGRWA